VASVGIVILGLDIADAAVINLKLTLNDKIRGIRPRKIKVIITGGLAIERDLDVLVAGLSGRHVFGVESQRLCTFCSPGAPDALGKLMAARQGRVTGVPIKSRLPTSTPHWRKIS
jgi:hypothetical protein